jgi:hypothetical protein
MPAKSLPFRAIFATFPASLPRGALASWLSVCGEVCDVCDDVCRVCGDGCGDVWRELRSSVL